MNNLRIAFESSSIPHEQRADYDLFCLIKSHAEYNTKKPGFITKKEVEPLAIANATNKRSYLRKLNKLASTNFIIKNAYGYRLNSFKSVHDNFNLKHTSKKNVKIKQAPFAAYAIPHTTDTRVVQVTRLYQLIKQINHRYDFRVNGLSRQKRKYVSPESFDLGYDKIMLRGKYKSAMEVWRLVELLERVGLAKIIRGKYNRDGGQCTKYTLFPFTNGNWNHLDKPVRFSTKEKRWNYVMNHVEKKPKVVKVKKVKKIVTYSQPELKFYKHLKNGLQDKLVELNVLSKTYESFGSKQRRVSKQMLSKLLTYALNSPALRDTLLKDIQPSQIKIIAKEGSHFNDKAFAYDRYTLFNYHQAILVEGSGNYSPGMNLTLKDDEYKRVGSIVASIMRGELEGAYI